MTGSDAEPAYYVTYGTSADGLPVEATLLSGISTFIGAPVVPPVAASLMEAEARAAILGFPLERAQLARPGASCGPRAIRHASDQYRGGYHAEFAVDLGAELRLVDCGDVAVVDDLEVTFARASRCVKEIVAAGALPIVFGGNDAITYPVVKSIAETIGGSVGYIHIDAHADTKDVIAGGHFYSGSPVRRISELPNIDPRSMAVIGVNGPSAGPRDLESFVATSGVSVFSIWEIEERGVEAIIAEVVDIAWTGTEAVILHTDLDVLDQAYACGVSAPEPGGLTPRELFKLVRGFARLGFAGYVIPECAPVYDPGGVAARLAARLALDALAARARPDRRGRALEAGV